MEQISIYRNTAPSPYEVSVNEVNGKQIISIPVVMMVPGVHAGSQGPVLHTESALSVNVEQWNGKPVVISHPQNEQGQYISANSAGVVSVGIITNAHYDNGLKATLELDASVLETLNVTAYTQILASQPMDVSIGSFNANVDTSGEFNGASYSKETTAYIADHLALLPNDEGACNWSKGCGIRVNNKNKKGEKQMSKTLEELRASGLEVFTLQVNEESLMARLEQIRQFVYSMDSEWISCYVRDVYEDSFVYEKNIRRNGGTKTKWYKQNYTLDADGELMIEEEPIPVKMKTEYIPVQVNTSNNNESKGENQMAKVESCCPQKVEELIVNVASKFTEEDREFLLGLNSEQLEKVTPKEVQVNVGAEHVEKHLATYEKIEDVIALIPEKMRAEVEAGIALHSEKRNELVESIQTNSKDVWTAEELQAMPTGNLEKISKSMGIGGNYAGASGEQVQVNTSKSKVAPMLPEDAKTETK